MPDPVEGVPPVRTRLRIIPAMIGIALATAGCDGKKSAAPTMPPPVVTVIRPATANVQNYYEYNGTLDAVESVQIQARVEGFLTKVLFQEGEEVVKNAPLYIIDPREYESAVAKAKSDIAKATADMENAKAQILLAESEQNRLKLVGEAGASKSELDKAAAVLAAALAQLNVTTANKSAAQAALQTALLKLSYTDIRAPIAGRINRTLVTPGNLVGQKDATLLTTIVSVETMYVYFDVPERDLVAYQRLLQKAENAKVREIPVEIGLSGEDGYPHRGTLDFQENRVETGTGTVRIRGLLPNPLVTPRNIRLLYPGLYCRVRVPAGPATPRVVIPEDALMTGQEGRYVFVLGPDNSVQKRTVTVGRQIWRGGAPGQKPDWTLLNPNPDPANAATASATVRSVIAIETGLTVEDRIVAVGLQKARPGMPVTPEEWQFRGPVQAAP